MLGSIARIAAGAAIALASLGLGEALASDGGLAVPRVEVQAEPAQGIAAQAAQASARDRALVETEIAAAAMGKVADWIKLLGFFVLAPLALALGVLGVKSFADVRKFAKRIAREQEETLETIRERKQEIEQLMADLSERRALLEEASKVLPQLRALGSKVEQLEKVITFKPSQALTEAVQGQLRSAVAECRRYFEKLGFRTAGEPVEVVVDPNHEDDLPPYYAGKQIVVPPSMASNRDAVVNLYLHHVLVSSLGSASGQDRILFVQYGLAFYFRASFKNEPLTDSRDYVDPPPEKEYESAMDVGSILGGAFWELRELIGAEDADALLFSAWAALKHSEPTSRHPAHFVSVLLRESEARGGPVRPARIRTVFQKRGIVGDRVDKERRGGK